MGKGPYPGMKKREDVKKQKRFVDRADHGAVVWQWVQVGFRSPWEKRSRPWGSWTTERLQVTYKKDKTSRPARKEI